MCILNHTCADVLTIVHFVFLCCSLKIVNAFLKKLLNRERNNICASEQIRVPNIYNFMFQQNEVLKFSCKL